MKIRNMFALALLGGAAYAHKKHGGEFTIESIRQSLMELWDGIQTNVKDVGDRAKQVGDKAKERAVKAADVVATEASRAASKLEDLGTSSNGSNRR